ncbi:BTAD domain-containing putative transcriptional regulator [Streptomyces sp. NPDC001339]|uniref:AfsR/SARP family transcriptional regulator n=1 Tax=Streptomyces sp. NPDC001339 TaxID=3364563 RepID=UPI00369212B4
MEFSVLGPLRMADNGRPYTPTAPKPRQLLALMLLNANQVVSNSTCIEELWEDSPPSSALSTLRSYVLQLRHSLGKMPRIGGLMTARHVLETRHGGYLFAVDGDALDVDRFTALVGEGRRALHQDDALASSRFTEALRIWQGTALSDVQQGPVLRARLVGLEEERRSVHEQRIDADLRLGRHQELLGELSRLTAEYPTHESLHARFMVALYRAGRPTQALDVLQRFRTVLRDELGMEPSSRIRGLHQAILRGGPAVDMPGHGTASSTAGVEDPYVSRTPAGPPGRPTGALLSAGRATGLSTGCPTRGSVGSPPRRTTR